MFLIFFVCLFQRGINTNLNTLLFSAEDVSEVTTVVHGIIMGVEMPFILQNPNACQDSGLKCPLTKDSTYQYSARLPVLKSYPKVSLLKYLLFTFTQI